MRKISLNGEYDLRFWDEQGGRGGVEGTRSIPAAVPGNVEIALMNAGILPDIYFGNNIKLLRPYEFYHWRYERTFGAPALSGRRAFLRFCGADCFCEYSLNGKIIGKSENALIEHRFEVTGALTEGENLLAIDISSPILRAAEYDYDAYCRGLEGMYEALRVRKAPSSYGWDIMPRAVSAGLWRGVYLEIEEANEIGDVYLGVLRMDRRGAVVTCAYNARTDVSHYCDLSIRLTGSVGGKGAFEVRRDARFVSGRFELTLEKPLLWWPRGYGEANVYDVKIELMSGNKVIAEHETTFGVRTVELRRTEITDARGGEFCFIINGEKILCKGSNWVPADAMHSRDAGRYEKMLEMWTDTESNILRCWGGNVYEDHAFFDYCDRHGIMVWQDFTMACGLFPLDESFMGALREEAESVVKKLRNHPSIVLWSGDNECDSFIIGQGPYFDPANNRLTREVLPRVIARLDPTRPYLPSSPYLSPALYELTRDDHSAVNRLMPENHLWGPRDYYKSGFYVNATSHFVSETGYHGANSLSSIRNFISEDKLWPWRDNDEWLTHAAEMYGPDGPYAYRIKLMADQIYEMFGFNPDNLEDFILASQISQAEAKKFFIEITRTQKWRRTGVIWWNMIDGWPQFSDAVVSYDFIKKLAYHYIKRSQQHICLMMSEPVNWHLRLMAGNDMLRDEEGAYRVYDGDTGATVSEGIFRAPANSTEEIDAIRVSHGEQRLFLMEWTVCGSRGVNHYVLGTPPLSFERYKKWLVQIAGLDGAFDAGEVGK